MRPAATDTTSTTTSNTKAARSTHITESASEAVGKIIQNAQTTIKAQHLQ
jgi:hypothetical protein